MRTETVKLYNYSELPTEAAKEKARDWWTSRDYDSNDVDMISDQLTQALEAVKLTDLEVSWNVGWSQSDGAAMDGTVYFDEVMNQDPDEIEKGWKWLEEKSDLLKYPKWSDYPTLEQVYTLGHLDVSVKARSNRNPYQSVDVETGDVYYMAEALLNAREIDEDTEGYDNMLTTLETVIERELEAFEDDWRQYLKDIAHDLYTLARDEIEWQMSEEAVSETLEINGYEFTETGEFWC